MFLKTATAQEMDIIRESLSTFQDLSKNQSNFGSNRKDPKEKEDEYIEEEFEEDIPEDDNEDGGSSDAGDENTFGVIQKDQQSISTSTHAGGRKKARPVSAVYDLSHFRTDRGHNSGAIQTQRSLQHGPPSSTTVLNTGSGPYAPATVKQDPSAKYSSLQAPSYRTGPAFPMGGKEPAFPGASAPFGAKVQAVGNAGIASKPFKRPFSEAHPGRRKHPQAGVHHKFME